MENEYTCAGDIVMLRSGGPWMTVEETEDGEVHCSYFVEGHLEHATFREEALLRLYEAEPAGGARGGGHGRAGTARCDRRLTGQFCTVCHRQLSIVPREASLRNGRQSRNPGEPQATRREDVAQIRHGTHLDQPRAGKRTGDDPDPGEWNHGLLSGRGRRSVLLPEVLLDRPVLYHQRAVQRPESEDSDPRIPECGR